MQQKHILYISYDGLTDFLGQSQVLPYILGLEEKGYRFSILSFEKTDKFNANKNVIEELIAGKNIAWYPKKYHKQFSILATLFDLSVGCMFLIRFHAKDAFDMVHCRSYISAMMGLFSKKLFKTKFVFDMRGFWADERLDGGLWNLKNPVFKTVYVFFKWIEKKCLLNADYVVTLTKNSYVEMQTWEYMSGKIKFKIIPCCADLNIFSRNNLSNDILQKKILETDTTGHTVLSYLGSVGTWYMIDEMFDYFIQFKLSFPDAVFLFITPEKESDIHLIAQKHGVNVDDIRVVKAQRKEVPYYLAMSNYALFFIKPSYSKKSSSPTKLAEIMAMEVPVICNANVGDVEEQLLKAKAGVILHTFEKAVYENTIQTLKNNLDDVYQKNVALYFVRENFSLENGVTLYSEIYSELFS